MSGQETEGRWIPATVLAAGAAGLVVVVGLVVLFTSAGCSDDGGVAPGVQNEETGRVLPEYVLAAGPQTALAYEFARDRPDVMLWMPCYCGCGGHDGHKSARDCFVKATSSSGTTQFDGHGSTCDVCVDIALRAREMTLAGASLSETRAAVDQEFGDIGPGTDTPLPPE